MNKTLLSQLETPCVVIDLQQAEKNLAQMQAEADACGCKLRPHIKTHKMPRFALRQIALGAAGITCAKVSEAEVMADCGIDDIFIAYPMVGAFRVKRVIALAKRIRRLILGVDSIACALPLNDAAAAAGISLEIRLEIDTGAGRTGVSGGESVALAKALSALPHLRLTGIYTFKSLVLHNAPTTDKGEAGKEEGQLMAETAKAIREAGISLKEISAGSTPTGIEVAKTGLVDEIRPGTYIFNDYMVMKEGAAWLDEIAARIYATVVSVPAKGYAVIDGGSKTFPMDITPNVPPYFYPGYGVVEGNPDLQLTRMNEEHGIITSQRGDTGLQVGDILSMIPIHVCPAVNMQNSLYLLDGEALIREPVTARGMLV